MQKTPLLILLGIIIIVGFIWMSGGEPAAELPVAQNNSVEIEPTPSPATDTNAEEADNTVKEAEPTPSVPEPTAPAVVTTPEETPETDDLPVVTPTPVVAGTYSTYSATKLAAAGNNDIVLFFKADWCPSCRVLDGDIKSNLDDIPSNVTILEVDYDSSTALKQKYGVTTQHTLVQVTSDGSLVKKWSGSPRLNSVIAEL